MKKVLLFDNADSFTFILGHYIAEGGVEVEILNSQSRFVDLLPENFDALVVSPGPGSPENAPFLMPLLYTWLESEKPILGVCLGHQALGIAFESKLIKAKEPVHGKVRPLRVNIPNDTLFQNVPEEFQVTRYHSLVIEALPKDWVCLATDEWSQIMAIRHKTLPFFGVQFHPESFSTEFGNQIVKNWLLNSNLLGL